MLVVALTKPEQDCCTAMGLPYVQLGSMAELTIFLLSSVRAENILVTNFYTFLEIERGKSNFSPSVSELAVMNFVLCLSKEHTPG